MGLPIHTGSLHAIQTRWPNDSMWVLRTRIVGFMLRGGMCESVYPLWRVVSIPRRQQFFDDSVFASDR